MIRQIVLSYGNGKEFGADLRRHLPCLVFLVVVSSIKGQGERADRVRMMFRRKAEDGAGVQTAAEVTTHRDVGAQAEANRFFQRLTEFRGVVGIGALHPVRVGSRVIEIPILNKLCVLVSSEQVVAGWNLKNAVVQRSTRMPARVQATTTTMKKAPHTRKAPVYGADPPLRWRLVR